ncbi:hypothetical protein GCM10029976_021220 [Kribbella albertanoniae]
MLKVIPAPTIAGPQVDVGPARLMFLPKPVRGRGFGDPSAAGFPNVRTAGGGPSDLSDVSGD